MPCGTEAGRPEGSALMYWLVLSRVRIMPKVDDNSSFTLQELAAGSSGTQEVRSCASGSVTAAVGQQGCPDCRRLPSEQNENRSAAHQEHRTRTAPLPSATTVEVSDKVPRRD